MNSSRMDHQHLFEYVYAFAPIGIALVSMDGSFLRANPALCRMLGYSEYEIRGRPIQDLTHPDDLTDTLDGREKLEKGEISTLSTEKRYMHKAGHPVWASLHVSLVRDAGTGNPQYFIFHIIDVTDKKNTAQMYKLISENARELIGCADWNWICYYVSPSVRELLGYEPEELVGGSLLDIVHPDDRAVLLDFDPAETRPVQYRNRRKDGKYVWFETTRKVIEDDMGHQSLLAIGRDITDRKRYEDLLAEAQEIAVIGSCEWDLEHETLLLSEQFYRLFHLDPNADVNHPFDFLHLVHPQDQDSFKEKIVDSLSSGTLNLEFRHVTREGSVRYLHARGLLSRDKRGNPKKMKGTLQDITELKQTELKLQELVERYTSLKKYNHDAVISLDLNGIIIHGNAVAEKLTGYAISELAGQSAAILIGRDHLLKILSESFHDASVENQINRFMHRDGHEVEVLTTIAPIIINKENVGFYIIAKDITEQKKLLIAKEAAESSNKAKSEFLAMMSHEIRTPMNGVLGMAELLADSPNLEPEQKEYIEIIRKSGNTLLAIINDILDFSKIDSGKAEICEQGFDIRDCVREVFGLLSAKAQEKDLYMDLHVESDVPHAVVGDPERLKQILMNLVGNAVKFTDRGGVTVSVTMLGERKGRTELEFTVRDTGIGIPPHEIDRLFAPFYQVSNSLNRNYEGTGLGLAISKKLVELMGGKIRIGTEAGPGAVLVFTLPFKCDSVALETKRQEEPDALPVSLNILVAEDNAINQKVISRMLQKMGHSVTIANDGQQTVQKALNGSYEMIFMDIFMPVMDGFEATRTIKNRLPPERCPVIVAMTANALIGDREKCLAAGMDEYISKPIRMDAVSRIIRQFSSP